MTPLFSLLTWFWVLAPIGFLLGRAFGVWNFYKDILIFAVLMGLCFLVCLAHVIIRILEMKERERIDRKNIEKRILNRKMNKA